MLDDEILNQIFENRQEIIEKNIQEDYHEMLKQIEAENEEERNNIKMNIISKLYYKQGVRDGVNFILRNIKK